MNGRLRGGVMCSTVVLALGVTAGTASACLNVGFSGGSMSSGGTPSPAAPDSAVPFSISNTEPGATYEISVDGQDVARGTDEDGGGVAGSFTMPDLGEAERTVTLYARVQHTDDGEPGEWSLTNTLQYAGRPAVQPASPSSPGPASQPSPPASAALGATSPPAPSGPAVRTVPAAIRDAGKLARRRPASRVSRPLASRGRRAADPGPSASMAPTLRASQRVSGPEPVPARSIVGPGVTRQHATGRAVVRQLPEGRILGPRLAPAVLDRRSLPDSAAAPVPALSGWMVLVAIAGLLAVAGGAVIVRRRPGGAGTAAPRPTPVPSSSEPGESLAIEAELQEIVAEGRAERDHQRSLV